MNLAGPAAGGAREVAVPPTIIHAPSIQAGSAVLTASSELPGSSTDVVAPGVTIVLPFSKSVLMIRRE
jgi:hypothetical protein